MTKCEAGILRTLAFFDVFDYAPTLFELWRWQLKTDRVYTVVDIQEALRSLGGRVSCEQNLYSLPGRSMEARVAQRRVRTLYALRKNKQLFRYIARFARFVFGIQGIAVCNTRLPFLYAQNNSDIDLLVVTRGRALWSVRFILVGALKLLRKRPGEVMGDAFDHSMFLSQEALNVHDLADINPVYMAAWVASVDGVYDRGGVWEQFAQENAWVNQYFPAATRMDRVSRWRVKKTWLSVFAVPERIVRAWQTSHLTQRIAGLANKSTAVVINDRMLKFHANDKRQEYLERYEQVCLMVGVPA